MLRSVVRSLLVLVLMVGAATAHAQQSVPAPQVAPEAACSSTTLERLLLREQFVRQRQYDRRQIRLGGPITGLLTAGVLLGAGATLAAVGDPGVQRGGGIVMISIGLPITILSAVVLAGRVSRRRAIEHEIYGMRLDGSALASGQLRLTF